MKQLLRELGIEEYDIIDDGLEASLEDSNHFGRLYTKLEHKYEIDEDISSVDNVAFFADGFKINLVADYKKNTYKIKLVKE